MKMAWPGIIIIVLSACTRHVDPKVLEECKKLINNPSPTATINLNTIARQNQTQATKVYGDDYVGGLVQELNYLNVALWPKGSNIHVCWNNADPNSPEALAVREAVEQTWNEVLQWDHKTGEGVQFVGWDLCQLGDTGIRITVNDEGPHTKGLGASLALLPTGMVLNFTFNNWSTICADETMRLYCIRTIAVHEFGHALGYAHEQNRSDTPTSCTDAPQGTNGNRTIGQWDLWSVMNYCSPEWNARGVLSVTDMLGSRYLYAPTIGKDFCQDLADRVDEQEAVYNAGGVVKAEALRLLQELFAD